MKGGNDVKIYRVSGRINEDFASAKSKKVNQKGKEEKCIV